jgi:hypothetical protein
VPERSEGREPRRERDDEGDAMNPKPDDVWTLACRAIVAATKLIPTETSEEALKVALVAKVGGKQIIYVKVKRGEPPGRTLQDDLDDKIVRCDQLFLDDGTPFL